MSESPSLLKKNGYLNFINDSNHTGYWEPHTSSIDFCESNYLHSHHIVEPHNVWSSLLGLSLFGIVGILYGNPTREWRTSLVYFILLVIGLGSACLHASLHWCFQSFDELPMIYLVICAVYAILEVDTPKGASKYPNLASYLVLLSGINTAVYYTFQHLYLVFLLTFTVLTWTIAYLHVQIAWRMYNDNKAEEKKGREKGAAISSSNSIKYNNNAIALQFYKWHHVSYVLLASPIWVLDQFHCGYFLPIYNNLPYFLRGMTLHVLWHIFAGMGAHYFIQFLCACRADTLGMRCSTRYVMGVLPVVVAVEMQEKPGKEKKQT